MLTHTFFLCKKEKELDRYNFLIKQIEFLNLNNVSFFHHIWGDEITKDIRNKYCRSDEIMKKHGRNMIQSPLTNGEISLYLNHIECLKYIKKNYTSGYFAIFESDAIFNKSYNNDIEEIMKEIRNINTDALIVYIGQCNSVGKIGDTKIRLRRYLNDDGFFAEGIIWSYNAVCRFLDHFEENQLIDSPIDTKYVFSKHIFDIYSSVPYLVRQGSISGLFNSHLR